MLRIISFAVFCMCFERGLAQGYGESCNQYGVTGRCVDLASCPSVFADPKKRWNLKRCGFIGDEPIICCLDPVINPGATPTPTRSTTTEYVPPFNEYHDRLTGQAVTSGCAPIPDSQTAPKTGRKAWDKCIEYQEKLVYPCEKGVDYLAKLSRKNNCNHNANELIVGGVDAKRNEFPHMALLGFGQSADNVDYQCGGAVISERFILTAGHCTSTKALGKLTYAKVGVLKRSENAAAFRVHRIKNIIKHPDFRPPSKYNDLALIETETEIKLDETTIPACLDIGGNMNRSRGSVTGWGDTESLGSTSDVLQKVTLTKFTTDECARKYRPGRLIARGFDESSQMCYGDHIEKKDTCQGDSGGPLQVNNNRIHCMYTIIGVTSFGKNCGELRQPGMYTRVAAYTPWIEGVVWP